MGKLSTALNLPKRIFLKDWGATEFGTDPNSLLSFTFILEPTPLAGSIITYSSIYSPSYPAPQRIYFWGSYWELRDVLDNSAQWFNNSSSPILPLTGWEIDNAQGPAGTITPILTNTKNISINKQNLGGGDLLLSIKKIQSPDEISNLILWTSKNTSFSAASSQTRLSRITFVPDGGTWPENIPQNYYRYDLNSEVFYGDFDESYYVFYSSLQGLWFINDDYVGSDIAGAENMLGSLWYSYGNEFNENGVPAIYIDDWDVTPWTSYGNEDAQWTWPGLKSNNNFVTRFSPRSSIQSVSQFGAPDFIKDINNYPFKATTTLNYTNPFTLYIVLRDYQGQDVGDSNICGNERAYINYVKTAGAGATFYLKYSYTQTVNLFNVNKNNFINAPAILKIVNQNFSGSTKRITVSFISASETQSYTGLWTPSPLYGLGLGGIDFYLGNKNLGSTNTFNGSFYDVVLYNRDLSSIEDTKVLRYLRERNL